MAKPPFIPNVTLEDVRIALRNFAGGPTKFNAKGGVRSFAAVIPQDIADDLASKGWVIKYFKAREEGEPEQPWLPVEVTLRGRNKATLISSRGRTLLTEQTIGLLDFADIKQVDLVVNASPWEVEGNSGYKTYMSNLFVTINEDELDMKYSNVPAESGLDSLANTSQTTPSWD